MSKKHTQISAETLEHLLVDLAERERLLELADCYTCKAIGQRFGLSTYVVKHQIRKRIEHSHI